MKYLIKNTGSGWLLKIWEPFPTQGDRVLPFLYKVKSIHPTEAEAQAALELHQQLNHTVPLNLAPTI